LFGAAASKGIVCLVDGWTLRKRLRRRELM
jgi:hypothetical protein